MTRGVQKSKHVNAMTKNRDLPFAEPGTTDYAWVMQVLGNMRVRVRMSDGKTEALGVIRGNMRKRVWIALGDLVLVSLRDFQGGKVDVVFKYSDDEIRNLRKYKEPVGHFSKFEDDPVDQDDIAFEDDPGDDSDVDMDGI
jgi:translation initiation factor 1A